VTFWYGVNAFELTTEQLQSLWISLPRMQAQKRIEHGDLTGMEHQDVYDLYYAAYGSKERAEQARTRFLEVLVREADK